MLTTKQSKAAFEAVIKEAHQLAYQQVLIHEAQHPGETLENSFSPRRAVVTQLESKFDELVATEKVRQDVLGAAITATGLTAPDAQEMTAIERALHPVAFARGRRDGLKAGFSDLAASERRKGFWI